MRKPIDPQLAELRQWCVQQRATKMNRHVFEAHERAAQVLDLKPIWPVGVRGLVTSLPRSGTGWLSRLIMEIVGGPHAKDQVCHEGIFGVGRPYQQGSIPRRNCVWDVTGFAAPWLGQIRAINPKLPIVHLIRHPVPWARSFINSFASKRARDWGWAGEVYVRWHRLNAWRADYTIVLEHWVRSAPGALFHLTGEYRSGQDLERIAAGVERGGSTAEPLAGGTPGWDELPLETRDFAEAYGYEKD